MIESLLAAFERASFAATASRAADSASTCAAWSIAQASCGAPVRFKSSVALLAVCASCRSQLVRKDLDIESLGKVAELVSDGSVVQLGTEGRWRGLVGTRRFEAGVRDAREAMRRGVAGTHLREGFELAGLGQLVDDDATDALGGMLHDRAQQGHRRSRTSQRHRNHLGRHTGARQKLAPAR